MRIFAFVILLAVPRVADACGGFFCSQTQSVNQAAERIIFAKNADGSVTSVVQILYQGPAEKFSWVLPVPSVPTVAVSSNSAFTRLQFATNPSYRLTTRIEGNCATSNRRAQVSLAGNASEDSAGGSANPSAPVDVVAQGSVGPYDYEVIRVNVAHADKAQVAVEWLTQNGYDVTAVGPALIRPYLEQGDLLIAFRLTKTSDAGDIRPVALTFQDDRPMIPIKLTAVAAQDNMGVLVWVLGQKRSVPINYRHLVLNDAAINWLTGASNYAAVVDLAADEAGGQGFVTEYAQSAETLKNIVVRDNERTQWLTVEAQDWTGKTAQLAKALLQFSSWDGVEETLDDFMNAPQNMTLTQWINCGGCGVAGSVKLEDGPALLAAFRTNVVKPMLDTQAVVDSLPYVTRLYSTLSAPEMTVDPEFDYNPDLPTLSNVHTAERVIECNPVVTNATAPWRVILSDGSIVRGSGTTWPLTAGNDTTATLEIVQMATSGFGEVVKDNRRPIADAVAASNRKNAGCACGASDGGLSAMVLSTLVLMLRRRRRAR
ncbi:MAG: DUF2330 domain-containing protein [Deltaproteobacteria bacterium]|nr:DUF2330 domain-containing protein [Deltaproteobacteria bacterium]